jgi:hypothetical protein
MGFRYGIQQVGEAGSSAITVYIPGSGLSRLPTEIDMMTEGFVSVTVDYALVATTCDPVAILAPPVRPH